MLEWTRFLFQCSVTSISPFGLLKNLMSGMLFSVMLTTLAAPASYYEPGFKGDNLHFIGHVLNLQPFLAQFLVLLTLLYKFFYYVEKLGLMLSQPKCPSSAIFGVV